MNAKIFTLVFALLFATVATAQDAPAKKKRRAGYNRNNMMASVLKQLEKAELTQEQKTKIGELAKKTMAEVKAAREEAGITPELMKKRAAALKEVRAGGEKRKPAQLAAEADKKIGLTEAQAEAFKKTQLARTALLKNSVALLSDEQKEKLPKQLLRGGKNAGKGQGNRAKKQKKNDQ